MSLSDKIAKGTLIFSSSTVILTVLQFITAVLVIRTLDKMDYGRLTLALSTYSIGSIFLDFAMSNVVSSEIAHSRGKERLDQVKRFLLRFSQLELMGGSFLLVVFTLASFAIKKTSYSSISALLPAVGVYLFLTGLRTLLTTTFYGYGLYKYMALSDVAFALSRFLLVLLLVVRLKQGVIGAISTYPLSSAITFLLLAPFWWRLVSPLRRIEASKEPVFRKALKEQGVYTMFIRPVKRVQAQVPIWMIEALLGTEMVSVYAVARKAFSLFNSFLNSMQMTLLPLTSERIFTDWKTTKNMLQRSVKYTFWGSCAMVTGGMFFAPLIFHILFSSEYLESIPVFRVCLLTFLIASFAFIQNPLLIALRAQKYLLASHLISVGMHILLLWLFIREFGILGTALAFVGRAIIAFASQRFFIQRLRPDFRIDPRDLLRIDEFDRRMLSKIRQKLNV